MQEGGTRKKEKQGEVLLVLQQLHVPASRGRIEIVNVRVGPKDAWPTTGILDLHAAKF